ncbi:MAG TPA: helix-turn-helix transcriptional regulator [Accumulibacter sp.]|uniref:helix-turn-helix domain-containing protein n=1 Tax=Accumulibacter sp. TaxID=2053492 RepID=UPI002BFCC5E2|nr:helix-turn-helix transcriptional regulator [Accumulibacter sp.]HRF71765.1 helix-turn-helix transcriptional regulator [Accumulibacter sp.]
MDNIAAAVAFFRKNRGWSMGQLAKYSDLSSEYISQLEAGKRGSKIRQATLTKLARGLRVTERDLLDFDPARPPTPTVMRISESPAPYGVLSSSDRQIKIIKAISSLSDEQLVKLESFLDWLIERGE